MDKKISLTKYATSFEQIKLQISPLITLANTPILNIYKLFRLFSLVVLF